MVLGSDVGRLSYTLDRFTHGGVEISNRLPVGTKIYTVRGQNPAAELAVEVHPDSFVRASDAGTRRPR
jgi:hypothetical protein